MNNRKRIMVALLMGMTLTLGGCASQSSVNEKVTGEIAASTETEATVKPTEAPTAKPTEAPTEKPTEPPTEAPTEKPTEPPTEPPTEAPTEPPTEPPTEAPQDTYEHNQYYDIVETHRYQDSIGYTHIVHKVLAKQTTAMEATLLAFAADGSVIGKSSDSITLSEGKHNFFEFSFKADVSNASFQSTAKPRNLSFMAGDLDAVEMVDYNQVEKDLYITFKQVKENLGSLAKFKLLFYLGDTLVDTDSGHFGVYAENLDGVGSTDVASFWIYKLTFDRLEYVFEP